MYEHYMFYLDFANPNLTLTCFDNTINLKWNIVHNHYNSFEEIKSGGGLLLYCNAEIKCDSGYHEKVRKHVYMYVH